MSTYQRTEHMDRIVEAMKMVHKDLIAYKKRMKSELVVMRGDKIVRMKP